MSRDFIQFHLQGQIINGPVDFFFLETKQPSEFEMRQFMGVFIHPLRGHTEVFRQFLNGKNDIFLLLSGGLIISTTR
jgi:hypothetical protein